MHENSVSPDAPVSTYQRPGCVLVLDEIAHARTQTHHPSYRGLKVFKAYCLPTMPIKLLQYVDMCPQASAEAFSGAIYPAHAFRENYRKCADKIAIPK